MTQDHLNSSDRKIKASSPQTGEDSNTDPTRATRPNLPCRTPAPRQRLDTGSAWPRCRPGGWGSGGEGFFLAVGRSAIQNPRALTAGRDAGDPARRGPSARRGGGPRPRSTAVAPIGTWPGPGSAAGGRTPAGRRVLSVPHQGAQDPAQPPGATRSTAYLLE